MYQGTYSNIYRTAGEINSAMGRVWGHTAAAIVTSMLTAFLVGSTPALVAFFFTGVMKWITIFAPLVAVFAISYALESNPSMPAALVMLHGFAALMGLSFSAIFAVYTGASITSAFFGGAVVFGVAAFWGYFTKRNLEGIGGWLIAGLIAVVLASLLNLWIGSSALATAISAVAVVVFTGLAAWDTQKIREMVSRADVSGSVEVSGALTLYLDFINIFLSLLQLFGDKKE